MKNYKILDIQNSTRYLLKVSEEINSNYIDEFILTFLRQESKYNSQNCEVIYLFLESIVSYLVITFPSPNKDFIILPQLFAPKDKSKKFTLLICDDLFALYEFDKLYFFKQKSDKANDEEIEDYLFKFLKINIDTIERVSNNNLKKQIVKNQLNFLKKKESSKRYKYFLSTFILCIFVSAYVYFDNKENIKMDIPKTNKIKIESKSIFIKQLFDSFEASNIKIKKIYIDNDDIELSVQAKDKLKIFGVIKNFDKLSLHSITFMESNGYYEATIISK